MSKQDNGKSENIPAFFIPHGAGPCFWVDWGEINPFKGLEVFLKNIPSRLPKRPKSILVISAHWEENEFTIQSNPHPKLLFDYYGFPKNTYQLEYPTNNSLDLVKRVKFLMQKSDYTLKEDEERNYDHGVFVPFLKIFPDASIPITQISLKKGLDPKEHIQLGKILSSLREEGVLIIGSGMSYHNLNEFHDKERKSDPFDKWLTDIIVHGQEEMIFSNLINWEKAPSARFSHPREEHLIPLMVVAGTSPNGKGEKIYSERMPNWNFISSSFQF